MTSLCEVVETEDHVRRLPPLDAQIRPEMPPTTRGAALVGAEGDVTWSAGLRYHGEYGVEAQILRNGELRIGRRFPLKEQAIRWAEGERAHVAKRRAIGANEPVRCASADYNRP